MGIRSSVLLKTLWGDFYLNAKAKKIMKGAQVLSYTYLTFQLFLTWFMYLYHGNTLVCFIMPYINHIIVKLFVNWCHHYAMVSPQYGFSMVFFTRENIFYCMFHFKKTVFMLVLKSLNLPFLKLRLKTSYIGAESLKFIKLWHEKKISIFVSCSSSNM